MQRAQYDTSISFPEEEIFFLNYCSSSLDIVVVLQNCGKGIYGGEVVYVLTEEGKVEYRVLRSNFRKKFGF